MQLQRICSITVKPSKKSFMSLTLQVPTYAGIRDHVVTAVELKFNCFFLMPLIDTFPTRLREELEAAYEEDLDEVHAMMLV